MCGALPAVYTAVRLSELGLELRYVVRSLRKRVTFSVFAVLALALGIGANSAIFSVIDSVLLRPLQFRDTNSLAEVWEDASFIGFPTNTPSPGNYAEWKRRNHVFSDMAALKGDIVAITGDGAAEQVEGSVITQNLFPLLGVTPVIGRNFLREEDRTGGARVAILSSSLWWRRYGGRASVIGQTIRLNGEPHQIVGVMPAGFTFPERSDIWTPLALSDEDVRNFGAHYLRVYTRLKPGVSLSQATREMKSLAAQLAKEHPDENTNISAFAVGMREQMVGDTGTALWVLMGGVGCILLIACANLAGLLMVRGVERRREIAVRAAIGASRVRLVLQAILESVILSLAGGALGLWVAFCALPELKGLVPLALAGSVTPQLDLRVLAFSFGISLVAGLLFGSIPAIKSSRIDLNSALQMSGRTAASAGQRGRRWLVVCEVALATTLVASAGLFVRTLWALSHTNPGFDPENVLTVRTNLPLSAASKYRNIPERERFYTEVLARVRRLPGVLSAGYTTFLPLTNEGGTSWFSIEGRPQLQRGQVNDANHRVVSEDYFNTMHVRLLAGRLFTPADSPRSAPVAIINEAMSKQYWPGESPLGRRFELDEKGPWITIVGIVETVRQRGLRREGRAEMYFPYTQPTAAFGYFTPRDLAIRTTGDPMKFAREVGRVISSVDPDQPVSDVMPMNDLIAQQLAAGKAEVKLLSIFAGLALSLAGLGLYGLLDYAVAQRRKEIGIRMALGAEAKQVVRSVIGEGLLLAASGLLIGIASALVFERMYASILYGVPAVDFFTVPVTVGVLLLTAGCACYFPASRAASVAPIEALRDE
jgi:putative ABC transport system permease protein